MAKNRYQNILPLAASRVRVPSTSHRHQARLQAASEDYINANFVGDANQYIATQAPLPHTIG